MKNKSFLLMLLLLAAFTGCKKEEDNSTDPYPANLDVATSKIQQSLDSLNNFLNTASASLVTTGTDPVTVRNKLQQLYAASSFVKEYAFITPTGIMQVIEPPQYYAQQGSDLHADTNVMYVIDHHQPLFSKYFHAIEGYDAVVDMHPVNNGSLSLGAIEGLFTPAELLSRIIIPLVTAPNEIWVMEMDGVMLYDPDPIGIGKNVFTDPYYNQIPSFVTACHTIIAGENGMTTYTFYHTGTQTQVTKKAWWRTIHLHTTTWKIVWSQEA